MTAHRWSEPYTLKAHGVEALASQCLDCGIEVVASKFDAYQTADVLLATKKDAAPQCITPPPARAETEER